MPSNNHIIRRSRRTLLGGKIIFNNRSSIFDCVVHQISDDGAVLKVASSVGVPSQFELRMGMSRTLRACEIAWRDGGEVGVAFLDDSGRRLSSAPAPVAPNVLDLGQYRQAQKPDPLD